MLPQLTRLSSRLVAQQCRRHLAASAVVGQKAGNLDPIQKLFLDKITEFKQQSQSGKLVDAEGEKVLQDNLTKLGKAYGATGQDMSKFPTFTFADADLLPVGVDVSARDEATGTSSVQEEEEDIYKPYFEL